MCESCLFFFFNETATTEIYTLSLHDALPIFTVAGNRLTLKLDDVSAVYFGAPPAAPAAAAPAQQATTLSLEAGVDWKSTPLKPRHAHISYSAFFFEKKK